MLASLACLAAAGLALIAAGARAETLAERLGYRATDRLLIINGDDTGMCHAANVATFDCLDNGLMTSATIMVPCPWFPEVVRYAREHPTADLGVHLCHTSEWALYRWGPVAPRAEVPGLVDPEGYLWRQEQDVFRHATPEQAVTEARAQVRRALDAGIDVTHLDSHMGAMQYDPAYHRAYLKLARELRLPVRMASASTYERLGFGHIRAEAAAAGLVFPDYLIHEEEPAPGESRKRFWMRILRDLKPGVTELYIHAAVPNDEARAIANTWKERGEDYAVFTRDPDVRRLIADSGIIRIGYRPLRDLQRKGTPGR